MHWIKTVLRKVDTNSKSQKKQKQFGYLLCTVLVILLSISIYKNEFVYDAKQNGIIILLVCIMILSFFFSKALYPLVFVWFLIGEVLGKITNYVVLGIIYYLVFSPIALILNVFNKKKRYQSGWINRNDTIDYDSLS